MKKYDPLSGGDVIVLQKLQLSQPSFDTIEGIRAYYASLWGISPCEIRVKPVNSGYNVMRL